MEQVHDNPTPWVNRQIRQYLETGGTVTGGPGTAILLLTTRGRRSGELRRTALTYGRDGDRYLLVASNGGAPKHPAWYLNLAADPAVTLQVGEETFPARARTATAEEKPRLWEIMVGVLPQYASYQAGTDREIPVVIVERA